MVEPLSAVSFSIAIAFRLGAFIADVVAAGDEFSDIVIPLQNTESTISAVKIILSDPTLPEALTEKYKRELRLRENELLELQNEFDEVRKKLSASASFFSRTKQKTLLAHGEMQRLTNKLNFFNQSLQNILLTHQAMVTSLIYGQTKRTEDKVDQVVERTSVRYSVTGLRGLVRDDVWDAPSAIVATGSVPGMSTGSGGFQSYQQDMEQEWRNTIAELPSTPATPPPPPSMSAPPQPTDIRRPVYRRPVYSPSTPAQLQIGINTGVPQTAPVFPTQSSAAMNANGEFFNPPPPYSANRSTSIDSAIPASNFGAGSLAPPTQSLRHSGSGRALQERYASGFRLRSRGLWND